MRDWPHRFPRATFSPAQELAGTFVKPAHDTNLHNAGPHAACRFGEYITNTHEIAAPAEKPAAKKTSRKAVPQTGDQSANALAVVALGATALGAAIVMKKRNEL